VVDVRSAVVATREHFTSLQDMIGFGTDDLRLEEADRSYYYPPRRCRLTHRSFRFIATSGTARTLVLR
jgi:hypothetical protein